MKSRKVKKAKAKAKVKAKSRPKATPVSRKKVARKRPPKPTQLPAEPVVRDADSDEVLAQIETCEHCGLPLTRGGKPVQHGEGVCYPVPQPI